MASEPLPTPEPTVAASVAPLLNRTPGRAAFVKQTFSGLLSLITLKRVLLIGGILTTWLFLVGPFALPMRWLGLLVALSLFAAMASGGKKEYVPELRRYLAEAIVSAGLATALVLVLSNHEFEDVTPEHAVVGAALAIVLSGISILANSARTIGEAEKRFDQNATQLVEAVGDVTKASKETSEAAQLAAHLTSSLKETVDNFREEVNKAHLVGVAARAVKLKSDTIEYPPIQSAVDAALGTMRTWAEGSRASFPPVSGQDCGAAEATWWRCLESYHNEERYDLARFEMVTNARHYTYILTAILDQVRSSAGLTPDQDENYLSQTHDVIVIQCSTFSPKDFYNFPYGAKGYRKYRDLEFYGTYRRSISFINRQLGMLPHRIVFVADDTSKGKSEKVVSDLERLGWAVDTPAHVALGSARLFCAPYSLPLSNDPKEDGPPYFLRTGWADADPAVDDEPEPGLRTGFGRNQVCPLVPALDHPPKKQVDNFRTFEGKALNYTAQIMHGTPFAQCSDTDKDEIRALLDRSPEDIPLPEDIRKFLMDRESWAWRSGPEQAFKAIFNTNPEDVSSFQSQYDNLKDARNRLVHALKDPDSVTAGKRFGRLVRDLVTASQGFDAACEELKVKLDKSVSAGSRWANLKSMTGLQMGAGEAWLYHALNCINGFVFKGLAPDRKAIPVWDLFCWDFLGLSDMDIAKRISRRWEDEKESRGIGSRIRFVKVKPGSRVDDDHHVRKDGVISALGFDKMAFQREFTLVGIRSLGAPKGADPFEGVQWAVLLTSEIAPPYSTCRLNFHYPPIAEGAGSNVLDDYVKWVREAWTNAADTSAQLFERLQYELATVEPGKSTSGQ